MRSYRVNNLGENRMSKIAILIIINLEILKRSICYQIIWWRSNNKMQASEVNLTKKKNWRHLCVDERVFCIFGSLNRRTPMKESNIGTKRSVANKKRRLVDVNANVMYIRIITPKRRYHRKDAFWWSETEGCETWEDWIGRGTDRNKTTTVFNEIRVCWSCSHGIDCNVDLPGDSRIWEVHRLLMDIHMLILIVFYHV